MAYVAIDREILTEVWQVPESVGSFCASGSLLCVLVLYFALRWSRRLVAYGWLLLLFAFPLQLSADDSHFQKLINCKEHRAKLDEVPVYSGPDESSRVVVRLASQERVCVIGEKAEFMIIDWTKQDLINDRFLPQPLKDGEEPAPEIVYVRQVDLYQFEEEDPDVWSRTKRHIQRMRDGVVTEDIYGPFRPVIDWIHPPTTCLAGKELCKKLEAQKDREEMDTQGGTAGPASGARQPPPPFEGDQ